MAHTTQISLLQQLKNKQDAVAWSKFVALYTPLVFQWVSNLNVQDVFLNLLGKISSFNYDATQSFRGWLRTMTINKTRDQLRKKRRLTEPTFVAQLDQAESNDTDYLTQQEYRDHLAAAALKLMSSNFSKTTWLACWEHVAYGKPAAEVAHQLASYRTQGRDRCIEKLGIANRSSRSHSKTPMSGDSWLHPIDYSSRHNQVNASGKTAPPWLPLWAPVP